MTVTLTFDTELSRVRIDASALDLAATTAVVERSTNEVTWTTVRGGGEVAVASGAFELPVDDYEFAADVVNFYRVTPDVGAAETASITPSLDRVWIKSIARPWLNTEVTVADFSEVTREARAGVFPVVGRSFPIAVSDVRSGKAYTLTLRTETLNEADNVDLFIASGDPLFLHVPGIGDLVAVPGGYFTIGATAEARRAPLSTRRFIALELTEIAAPGPDVVGATVTWQGVLNAYATWSDVLAAHADWEDLLELIGDPTDVVVP